MHTKKEYLLIVFLFLVVLPIISAANSVSLIRNNIWSSNLSGVFYGSLALGDIDNDGDYDLIGMGCVSGGFTNCATADKIRVYINNGTTFNESLVWEQNTTNLGYGSLALGDIDNDGDLDFVALGDRGGGSGTVRIYINNGTTFNEDLTWQSNLSAVDAFNGAVALGDIDNDGDLDLALVGAYPSNNNGIYINNGTTLKKNSNWLESLPLVGLGNGGGALIFGDFNNDGDLDLAFSGSYNTNFYDNIYRNNRTSLVGNSDIGCDPCSLLGFPSFALGDINNDGDLDLAYMGAHAGDKLYVYNNTDGNFTEKQLVGAYLEGSIAFGDIDNDGDLDLGAMGRESGRDRIFTNNNTSFEADIFEQQDMHDDNMEWGGLSWIDVDGDKNIDLIINGYNPSDGSRNFTVYISNASLTKNNTPPTPPFTFSSVYSVANNTLTLGWNNGSDNETPSTGLYYNLMVGNSTTNHTIVSGVYGGSSNPTAGYFGNMMQRKNITLNLVLPAGTYYWYVQTIDTGLAKSNWSARQSFTVGSDTTAPSISNIANFSITSSTATIFWNTDEMANSTIYYGTTISTTSKSNDASWTMSHSIGLSGLSVSTLYYYNVSSCDDSGNCNTSIQYNFTTSNATQSETPTSGGGSGGAATSFWTTTKIVNDTDFNSGFEKELTAKQRIQVSVGGESHYIGVISVNNNSGTVTINISSNPIQITLRVGEERKVDVSNDGWYDIYLKLVSILNNKANLTIKAIHEEVSSGIQNQSIGEEVPSGGEDVERQSNWLLIVIGIAAVLITDGIIFYLLKREKVWKKEIKKVEKKRQRVSKY